MRDTIRTTKISEAERQAMLDRLDAAENQSPAKQKRGAPRVAFRKNEVAVRVHHPGGSTGTSQVTTRNLSAGGVSFLYQGFLHKNTVVEIVLKRRLGGSDTIRGTVQHCALVNRTFHLIGMRFDSRIFPKLYLDPSEWGELEDGAAIDQASLAGNVLHLDDQEMDRLLLQHFLKGTKVNLTSVARIDQALEAIGKQQPDCILCDLVLDHETGELAISRFRDAGYAGPIAVVTTETSSSRIKSVTAAGAGAILSKPFDPSKLISLLSTWLPDSGACDSPLYSSLSDQPSMQPMIEQYVTRVHALARDLRKQMAVESYDGVRAVCQIIRGTAAGFGFQTLADVARDAVRCLDASNSLGESAIHVQQLEQTCHQIRGPKSS